MDSRPYKNIILAGDQVKNILLPEEGKHRLSLAKESDSDEPLDRIEAIKTSGGLAYLLWLLGELGIRGEHIHFPSNKEREEIHWGLQLLPRDLFAAGPQDPKVYRVTDRHLHKPLFCPDPPFPPECLADRRIFETALTVIADYGHNLTKQRDWGAYKDELRITGDTPLVRRIILLARRLPYPIIKGRPPDADEHFWNLIYDKQGILDSSQRDTLVITSLDRLRQDGARISKRVSWDQTLEDFAGELTHFPPLQRLGFFGHLVVRVGVSGALYYGPATTNEGTHTKRPVKLIYDPRAKGGIYRDLLSQGNVFGTRAAFAACIIEALYRGGGRDQSALIEEGIGKAIRAGQFLYREGFGDSFAKVKTYPKHLEGGLAAHLDATSSQFLHPIQFAFHSTDTEWGIVYANLLCGHTDLTDIAAEERETRRRLMEYRRLRCAMQIVLSGADEIINRYKENEWVRADATSQLKVETILLELTLSERVDVETEVAHYFYDLMADWSAGIATDCLQREQAVLKTTKFEAIKVLFYRFWRAKGDATRLSKALASDPLDTVEVEGAILQIIDHARNSGCFSDINEYLRNFDADDEAALAYFEWCLGEVTASGEREERGVETNPIASVRNTVNAKSVEIKELSQRFGRLSVPFNFPIARFGRLRVVGRKEVEAFNDIRNRILFHVQSDSTHPLSLAVFGPPGSGKSFGVTEIVREQGTHAFEEIVCNLSQANDISLLHKTFLRIGDALATGRIPLVFFDEFDSPGPGKTRWLKYFLQPMQDGYYQHPDGRISVGRSIFIFAGTDESYAKFKENASKAWFKEEKVRDFVSRVKGFVNIPHISPSTSSKSWKESGSVLAHDDEYEIPYLRRAMLIRSILEQKRLIRPFDNQSADCDDCGHGLIDVDILCALLLVKEYRHGARSISALLDIASPFYNSIVKASMPSKDQLDIHTNEADFTLLLKQALENGKLSLMIESRLLNGMWEPSDADTPNTVSRTAATV